jgi:hypothetical protein
MQAKERINVRGTMTKMKTGDKVIRERQDYAVHNVRVTASILKSSYGLPFTVRLIGDKVLIERL